MRQDSEQPKLKAIIFATGGFVSLDGQAQQLRAARSIKIPAQIPELKTPLKNVITHFNISFTEIPLCFSSDPQDESLAWHQTPGWEALSQCLQYVFTNGECVTVREILFHPLVVAIPRFLLPLTSSIRYGLQQDSLFRLFDAYAFPVWGGLRSAELSCLSILLSIPQTSLECWVTDSFDRSIERWAYPIDQLQLLKQPRSHWVLEPVDSSSHPNEQASPRGEAFIHFEEVPVSQNSEIFHCIELDSEQRTLLFHSYSYAIEVVNRTFENHYPATLLSHRTRILLSGHAEIEEFCQKCDQQLILAKLGAIEHRKQKVIASTDIQPQLWINPDGTIQFSRKLFVDSREVQVWNISKTCSWLMQGLHYGLGSALQKKTTHLVQTRKGMKRDRDLKVLRHVGFFSYLIFESLKFLQKRESTEPPSAEELETFRKHLFKQLGILLYKIEKKAGLIQLKEPQSLESMCSVNVIEYIKNFIIKLIEKFYYDSDRIFLLGHECLLQGGSQSTLWIIYATLSRVALQTRGECFLKTRLGLFSGFIQNQQILLDEKWVELSKNTDAPQTSGQLYLISQSPWLAPGQVLHAFLPLRDRGFSLFYQGLPLNAMDMKDFKPEFHLRDAQDDGQNTQPQSGSEGQKAIDWFELHPRFFFKGVEIDPLQLQRLSTDGILEFQGKIYLIQNKNIPSVKRLENFWSKIQQNQVQKSKGKTADRFLRLPKSQILEMLALRASGIEISSQGERWQKICHFYDSLNQERPPLLVPPSICTELKLYQKQGVQWLLDLYDLGLGGILGDDMGLGKTVQTLTFLEILRTRKELGLVLVVVPTSLTFNWMTELKRFSPEIPVQIFQSKFKFQLLELFETGQEQVVICTYGLFTEHQEFFQQTKWNILIFDEAQNLKNMTSKRTTASRSIQSKFKVCLTGTPLENHLGEFYSLLDLAVSGSLGELSDFREKFITPEVSHQEDMQYLKLKIKPLVLRRTKSEVLSELPPKMESVIRLPFEEKQEKIYRDIALSWNEKVKDSILNQGESKSQILMLTALLRLRQVCSDPASIPHVRYQEVPPKVTVLTEALQEITESGESALVFTQFLHTFERIKKALNEQIKAKVFSLHGGTSRVEREKILSEFQATKQGAVLLMTLKTGGVGLNLTKASYVFHLEPWWNPAVEDQATDRTYRVGQEKPVQVYRYLMRESVEEKIEILKTRKLAKFNALFSSTEMESELISGGNSLTQADFDYLLGISG